MATRVDLERRRDGFECFPHGPAEVVVYDEASTRGSTRPASPSLGAKTIRFAEPMVFEVADAELAGSTPLGFDAAGRVLLETTPPQFDPVDEHLGYHLPLLPLLERRLRASSSVDLDVVSVITNAWTNNYWHWLIDVLTRLKGLEDYAARSGVEPTLIVPRNLRSWQIDSLNAAGHDPGHRIVWSGRRAHVRRLVIPSFRRHYARGTYHRPVSVNACRWLRDRILENLAPPETAPRAYARRIYIARSDAAFRRVENEAAVIAALEDRGFEAYVLSDMSFAEQVYLFANAEVVVAPHGAALANLIFAVSPIVIELFSPSVIPLNAHLARGLGFRYGYLRGTYSRGARGRDGNMVVDVNEMLGLMEDMEGT